MGDIRILFLHPKEWDDERVDAACRTLLAQYSAHAASRAAQAGTSPDRVSVVSGRADYAKRAPSLGGYSGWVVSLTQPQTAGDYRFTHLIVPERHVGRATGEVIQRAVKRRRQRILFWDGTQGPKAIQGVREENAENWQSGWTLVLA